MITDDDLRTFGKLVEGTDKPSPSPNLPNPYGMTSHRKRRKVATYTHIAKIVMSFFLSNFN